MAGFQNKTTRVALVLRNEKGKTARPFLLRRQSSAPASLDRRERICTLRQKEQTKPTLHYEVHTQGRKMWRKYRVDDERDAGLELVLHATRASLDITYVTKDENGSISVRGQSSSHSYQAQLRQAMRPVDTSGRRMKTVSFHNIVIHEHPVILGDHPGVSKGAPTCLDWTCQKVSEIDVDTYEKKKSLKKCRTRQDLLMTSHQRSMLLLSAGNSLYEIGRATIEVQEYQKERLESLKRVNTIKGGIGRAFSTVTNHRLRPRFQNLLEHVKRGIKLECQVEITSPKENVPIVPALPVRPFLTAARR